VSYLRHLPNLICVARIALIWPIVSALQDQRYYTAVFLFAFAAASDGLDGYLAKRFHWQSELGKFLDPSADKLLLATLFIQATWLGLVPWWLTAAAIARDALIALGALSFSLLFGPLRGKPTIVSKINTALQLLYLLSVMTFAASGLPPAEVVLALAVFTLVTTVLSGIDYVAAFTRRALLVPPAQTS